MFHLFFFVECEWFKILRSLVQCRLHHGWTWTRTLQTLQADLLYVTELEDAHDSINLLNSDDNPGFFYTETQPISDSDEILDNIRGLVCVVCILLSRSPVSSCVSLKSDILRYENRNRALSNTARGAGTGWI